VLILLACYVFTESLADAILLRVLIEALSE